MVIIVTGDINSGKTTKLNSIYNKHKKGEGFVLKKVFSHGEYIGQEIIRLSTGEKMRFSYIDGYLPDDWDEKYCYDKYSFSKKGFEFVQKIILEAISRKIEPIFIDEVGPLELSELGFYSILMLVLKMNKKIYISVRQSCLKDVIEKFGIRRYRIIKI